MGTKNKLHILYSVNVCVVGSTRQRSPSPSTISTRGELSTGGYTLQYEYSYSTPAIKIPENIFF